MTTATQIGRQLHVGIDGIPEPFIVQPISARRGHQLTEHFLTLVVGAATGNQYSPGEQETVFIESLGPTVYARMLNLYVDEFDADGALVRSYDDRGEVPIPATHPREKPDALGGIPIRFIARDPINGERELDNEPVRQEEGNAVCLCAFYWQTVVGIEAVEAFLAEGGGNAGSLKAMALLRIRLGSSPSSNSSRMGTVSSTEQDDSTGTNATAPSSSSVRLPANKRGFMQNPNKRRPTRLR